MIYTFNHDAGRWEAIGAGTVSEDGQTIVSDPGVGIRAPGWHVIQPGVITQGNLVVGRRGGLFGRTGGDELAPQTGRHYYALQNLDTGFVIRGRTDVINRIYNRTVLSANANYRLSVFGLVSGQIGSVDFQTPDNGAQITVPIVVLDKQPLIDTDNDLLDDRAEFIIGTRDDLADTDSDGIRDRAELLQGLNPFNALPFPTGVISELPLNGAANELTIEGSTQSSEGQTAYVATSAGLAVLDVTEFDNPIVLGQLDLGDAKDVSVDSTLGIAAVAANNGLHLVNVDDPMLPQLIETVDITLEEVEVIEGVAYTAVGSRLVAYDLQTGDLLDRTLSLTTGRLIALDREGSTLYVVDDQQTLTVVDASSFTMVPRGEVALPKRTNEIFAGGGLVYATTIAGVGLGRGGFMTIDVSDPDDPRVLADGFTSETPVTGSGIDFATSGAGLGVLIGGAISVIPNVVDVFNLTAPFSPNPDNPDVPFLDPDSLLTRFFLPETPRAVEIASGVAYTATGNSGIVVTNFKSFDSGGVAPSVSLSTSVDVDPTTDGVQVEEGKIVPLTIEVADIDNPDTSISDPNNPGPAWVEGRFDNGLFFDFAGGDALDLDAAAVNGLADGTIEFWYRTPKTERQTLFSGANAADPESFVILLENETRFRYGDATWDISAVGDNAWRHYAIVRNQTAGEVSLYINGVHQGTETLTLETLSVDGDGFLFGQQQGEVGGGFSPLDAAFGTFDELRIWDTVRSATDIQTQRNTALTGSEAGLRAYWDFSEGSGTTVTGRTANAFAGTLVNVQPLARIGQVRSVELLINGEVVRNDVSFPFEDFRFRAPRLDDFEDPVELQVRAIDTGGNIGLSETLIVQPAESSSGTKLGTITQSNTNATGLVQVVPDTTKPLFVRSNPEEGGVRSKRFRTLRLGFNESMDPATLTAENFRLVGPEAAPIDIISSPSGNVFPLIDVQSRKEDSEVQLTYARLVPGDYELFVNEANVADAAGNPLGTGERVVLRFTVLDADSVFVNSIGGSWTDPDNWDTGEIPRDGDEVFLSTEPDATVTYTGNSVIRKIAGDGNLRVSGGTLDVTETIEMDGDLELAGGTVKNATLLNGANGRALFGTSSDGALDQVTLEGDGVLDTGSVTTVRNGIEVNGTLRIQRTNNSSSNTYDTGLDFASGDQILSGTGTVELFSALTFSNEERDIRLRPTSGGSLTIGSNVTVRNAPNSRFVTIGNSGLPTTILGTVVSHVPGTDTAGHR